MPQPCRACTTTHPFHIRRRHPVLRAQPSCALPEALDYEGKRGWLAARSTAKLATGQLLALATWLSSGYNRQSWPKPPLLPKVAVGR
jgi:hypothetical protein